MTTDQEAVNAIQNWWDGLTCYTDRMPAKGTVAGSLIVLERLKITYNLNLDFHRTQGKSQIQGVGGAAVQQILNRFGITKQFLSEGGRTNRGLAGDIDALLSNLQPLNLEAESPQRRTDLLDEMQRFLAERVQDYFNLERIKIEYDPTATIWETIRNLLNTAREKEKVGQVAEYLVGAKLALRFPDVIIENKSYSTSDQQTGRPGDFIVSDSAFHVTVHPTPNHYLRCRQNIARGLKPYLLVPNNVLHGTQQNAEIEAPGKITVLSIESFVSQNINEMAVFSSEGTIRKFSQLLEMYNQRVDAIERDKSLLIDIPHNLQYK